MQTIKYITGHKNSEKSMITYILNEYEPHKNLFTVSSAKHLKSNPLCEVT